jgi:hypothetical protein
MIDMLLLINDQWIHCTGVRFGGPFLCEVGCFKFRRLAPGDYKRDM